MSDASLSWVACKLRQEARGTDKVCLNTVVQKWDVYKAWSLCEAWSLATTDKKWEYGVLFVPGMISVNSYTPCM